MKLPAKIKGWLNIDTTPERLLTLYATTSDKKYLSQLVAKFNLSLYHYLFSLSTKEMAEDALQSTWLKVMRSAPNNMANINVKSWLFTIARNTLIDELRFQQKWQFEQVTDQNIEHLSLNHEFESKSQLEVFNLAITRLPFHQREAIIFQQEGFSVMEICQLTNEEFETVKSRLRYARQNLKNMLEAYYER